MRRCTRNVVSRPDLLATRRVPGTRLLGWLVAAHAVAVLVAVAVADSAATGAARHVAAWCGIG